ncbi:hypothetical protein QS257_18780 [Terrilactibacillus sp. S3-3]|nr:hypothetical protein QS257_18780 [Terrilactibacillus sp. S3-3]
MLSINLYSSFIVYHNWGLLIHSSCVIENGKAHIFSGQSEAEKTTVAKLSYPRQMVSDEATLLKITPDGVTVFDSPFRSSLESMHGKTCCPVGSIQILYRSFQNKRVRLEQTHALLRLMDKVFFWTYNPLETKRILNLLKQLASCVPVYDLYFQKNSTFLELIS